MKYKINLSQCADERREDCDLCCEKLFFGVDSLREFCEWLFGLRNITAMAHNSGGYDGQFVLDYLHKNSMIPPEIISRGLQLITIKVSRESKFNT
jgi:hypothetical protein